MGDSTSMKFAPNLDRDPTFFVGKLNKKINFREAISALHDVVVSDLRYKPKDRTEYKLWAEEQEKLLLGDYMAAKQIDTIKERITNVRQELNGIYAERNKIMAPFYNARSKYFDYLYKNDKDAWMVLDPVISVHPDELFFECFSIDESSYGKLSCNFNVFNQISDFKCGTTNIDYSSALYNEFQRIRNYKDTEFIIDPSGFEVKTTNADDYKESKIDLPDSWVRGFLQVSSAMTLPSVEFDLHPMDVFSLCQYLRRFKEKNGPRAIRYILTPDKPIQVCLEPWNEIITFYRSIYKGTEAQTVRVWGRRRIHILERLIPIAKSFKVFLMGSGLPSFYIADLGDMSFTLGLSGWTNNDWSGAANFDLLAPRENVDFMTKSRVFESLKTEWFNSSDLLASNLNLETSQVASSLTAYTQAGSVIYDLNKKVYRVRELSKNPIDLKALRFTSPQETLANKLIEDNKVQTQYEIIADTLRIKGTCKAKDGYYNTIVELDKDNRIFNASCQCDFYKTNKLKKGPCEHILASAREFGSKKGKK
jgi:hypothetical protein